MGRSRSRKNYYTNYTENPYESKTSLRVVDVVEFTDVTLVQKDEQPPVSHRVILSAVRP